MYLLIFTQKCFLNECFNDNKTIIVTLIIEAYYEYLIKFSFITLINCDCIFSISSTYFILSYREKYVNANFEALKYSIGISKYSEL